MDPTMARIASQDMDTRNASHPYAPEPTRALANRVYAALSAEGTAFAQAAAMAVLQEATASSVYAALVHWGAGTSLASLAQRTVEAMV